MSVVPAVGFDGIRTIQAVYKNIKVCVDGVEMTLRDTAGQEVEPFIYNGTTYLPVRAVGEAIGKEVSYDGSTSTVYIGKSGQVNYLGQQVKAYQTDKAWEDTVTMGGQNYLNGLVFDTWVGGGNAYYNLNGLYTSVSGVYGMSDKGTRDDAKAILSFYGDGRLIETFTVKGGELPKNFAVNVSGVAQLKIEVTDSVGVGSLGSVDLGNVEFR